MPHEFKPSGTPKYEEIELGARVCNLLKRFYHADYDWVQAKDDIGRKFTTIKSSARKIYADKTENEMLDLLGKYDKFDFDILLEEQG
jgi:hypothetical protein